MTNRGFKITEINTSRVGCIVLAGGQSLRFGQDKAAKIIGNRTLLEWVLYRLSFLNTEIIIVAASKQFCPRLGSYPQLSIVTDIYPDKGVLGGIYTGLKISRFFYILVVACDMPFLNQDLLRYMILVSAGFDLVVPRLGDMIEPLHAIYSKNCLDPIESLLKRSSLSPRGLFNLVRTRYVEAEEINQFDPEHLSFLNINTEADLEKAAKLIQGELQ